MSEPEEVLVPLPHPVLTSLCRLIADRLGADMVLITDPQDDILAAHSWPLKLNVPPLATLLTADLLVLTDTTADPRFEALADTMGGFRIGFYIGARLKRADGAWLGSMYLLRQQPRRFERPHYQALLDATCLASDYLVQHQALLRAVQVEARLLPYESSVEYLTDAVLAYSESGQITYANPAAGRLFEAAVAELEGAPLKAVIPGGLGVLPEANAHRWQLGHVEGRTGTGAALVLDIASRQLQVDGTHSTLLIRDRSSQQADQHALAQSQLHAQALLQAIPDTLFVLSREGMVLSYQPDGLALLPNPVGRSVYHLWPPVTAEQVMLHLRLSVQRNERSRPFVLRETPSRDPRERTLEGRVTPMGPERALLVLRDITLAPPVELGVGGLEDEEPPQGH